MIYMANLSIFLHFDSGLDFGKRALSEGMIRQEGFA